MVQDAFKVIKENPIGFSYKPRERVFASKGYMCSILKREDEYALNNAIPEDEKIENLDKYLAKHWDLLNQKNIYLGGYKNEAGDFVLDISGNFDSFDEVAELAVKNNQESFYHYISPEEGELIFTRDIYFDGTHWKVRPKET